MVEAATREELEPLAARIGHANATTEPRIREAARTEWVAAFAGCQHFKKAGAIAAAAIGEYEEAEAFFRDAVEEAERIPIKLEQPEIRRWYAKMLIERDAPGDRTKAQDLLGEAIDGYRACGMLRHLKMTEELLSVAER